MKKMHFVLISVIVCVFLFFSCGKTGVLELDTEKAVSETSTTVESGNDNDQGEDEGNGNKPPIVVQPGDEPEPEIEYEIVNLLEKYNLSTRSDWFIWNDYMPGGGWKLTPEGERASICTISFDSPSELPPMEVSATIITERITIPVLLYDIYNGNGTYGKLFRKDFRPVDGFRLNNGEVYTIEITVKIHEEKQVLIFENLKVSTTW